MKRSGISKRTRFEVFKRDSFKCQYCGKGAPEVVLHVDHINPVSKGGEDDLLNLVTACISCNLGKSDKTLDDDSAIAKQRQQLEELNERREQLEMLLEWREGLKDIGDSALDAICEEFASAAPGQYLNDRGKQGARKLLRQFTLNQILDAIQIAGEQYVQLDADGKATQESAGKAWAKIGGICRLGGMDEDQRKIYYVRGICRNRYDYYVDWKCMDLLKEAQSLGVSIADLMDIAKQASSWSKWQTWMYEAIEQARRDGEA